MNRATNHACEEINTDPVRPLANLIGIDLEGMDHLSVRPEQIDEVMEKRLNKIISVTNCGETHILDGIELIGKLMWCAGINPECKEIGQEFEHDLLNEGGVFVQCLVEMLRTVIFVKDNAQHDLQCALEYRLKQGGSQ